MVPLDVARQRLDHAFAPGCGLELARDVFTDPPVEVDERRVDGGQGPAAAGLDHLHDLGRPVPRVWRRERTLVGAVDFEAWAASSWLLGLRQAVAYDHHQGIGK